MEKKYYYIDAAGQQHGPFTVPELIAAGISPTTYVWYAGMPNWKFANDVPEVAAQLNGAPAAPAAPAYAPGANYGNYDNEPMPSSFLGWAIAATLLCCLPFGVVSIVFASQVNSKWMMGDKAGARRSAQLARNWFWASVGSALLIYVIYIIMFCVSGISVAALAGLYD